MLERLQGKRGLLWALAILLLIVLSLLFMMNSLQGRAASMAVLASKYQQLETLGGTSNATSAKWLKQTAADDASTAGKSNSELLAPLTGLSGNESDQAASQALATTVANLKSALERQETLASYLLPVGLGLLLLYSGLVIGPQILKEEEQVQVAIEAKEETTDIMQTVTEGLFLLDREFNFGMEQSKSLQDLFRMERQLEGNFFDFISQFAPQTTVTTAADYVELLFSKRVKENLVKDLNPLDEVEISIVRRDGSFETRYLDFGFTRVQSDGEVNSLLVSVRDKTREVQLRKELETTKEEQEAQMELLVHMLSLDRGMLSRFADSALTGLNEINEVLERKGHSNTEIRQKLTQIQSQAHRLKGDAGALGLHGFEFSIHDFETQIAEIQNLREALTGKSLLPALGSLKEAFTQLDVVQNILSRFAGVSETDMTDAPRVAVAQPKSKVETKLHLMAQKLEERQGARIHLTTFGLEDSDIPEDYATVIEDSAVQLLRNAVSHGFTSADHRLQQGKSDFINIAVSLVKGPEDYRLTVRDDGDGIRHDKVLARAKEIGLVAADTEQVKVGNLIFHPKFSIKDQADVDSGRGVGLHAVYQLVRSVNGSVMLSQTPGKYCQFQLKLPATA